MLAKRVIPCMDVKDGRVVKGVNFVNLRDAGDPIELAQRYDEQRADEVIFLDITATSDKRETTVDLASRASAQLHLPYCVGGGFRSVADIRQYDRRRRRQGVGQQRGGGRTRSSSPTPPRRSARRPSCAPSTRSRWPATPTSGRSTCTAAAPHTGIDAVEWARRGGASRRGRDLADQHGPRRQQATVLTARSPARWRARWTSPSSPAAAWASSSTSPRASSTARPTRCWPPASSTSVSSR